MSSYKVNIAGPGGRVIFQASSPLSESRSASYDPYGIVHLPTSMWAYRNTSGRKYQIQGKIVSRNANEAGANAGYLNLIRKWVLPEFGGSGATPPIVYLSAYDNDNIDALQCVITSYSWSFPEDVDYIYAGSVPMPIIGMLTVDLEEVYSAEQITGGAWKILNGASGSFADAAGSAGGGGGGGSTGGGGGSLGDLAGFMSGGVTGRFGGIANAQIFAQIQLSGGGLLGSAGTILGGIVGGKAGGAAGAVLGSIAGNAIGTAISQSPQLQDVFSGNSNVFQSGITQATIAEQTVTPQEAFRNSELTAGRDDFQRDFNPSPPDLADFYG